MPSGPGDMSGLSAFKHYATFSSVMSRSMSILGFDTVSSVHLPSCGLTKNRPHDRTTTAHLVVN